MKYKSGDMFYLILGMDNKTLHIDDGNWDDIFEENLYWCYFIDCRTGNKSHREILESGVDELVKNDINHFLDTLVAL